MNPTGFYTYVGDVKTDIIDVFGPLAGDALTYNTRLKSINNANKDLSELFEPYNNNGILAGPTKYVIYPSLVDINTIFKSKSPLTQSFFMDPTTSLGSTGNNTIFSPNIVSMYNNVVLLPTNEGACYRSTNYGNTWAAFISGSGPAWKCACVYKNIGIICDASSTYLFTNISNDTSSDATFPTFSPVIPTYPIISVSICDDKAMLITEIGQAFVSNNSGATFNRMYTTNYPDLKHVSITKKMNNTYAAVRTMKPTLAMSYGYIEYCSNFTGSTSDSYIRLYNDASGNAVPEPTCVQISCNYGVLGDIIGNIYYTKNSGTSWSKSLTNPNAGSNKPILSISIDGPYCIAITDSSYLLSTTYGKTWSTYTLPTPTLPDTPSGTFVTSCATSNGNACLPLVYSYTDASNVTRYSLRRCYGNLEA
jgi:hypothetical protein